MANDFTNITQKPKKPRGLFEQSSRSSEDIFGVEQRVDTPKFLEQQNPPRDFSFRVCEPDPESKEGELPALSLFLV